MQSCVKKGVACVIRILFMGRKKIAAETLAWLSTIEDVKIVGVLTDHHLRGSPTFGVAQELGYPVYSFESALKSLQEGSLEFDLGISILYWRKLKGEFLNGPQYGVINFHPAPLPEYKGTGGYNFAILDRCVEWGVSAHFVDEGIDTGDIIEVSQFPIDIDYETCQSLERKSVIELEALVRRVLTRVVVDKERLPRMPNKGGKYISRLEMELAKKIEPGDDVERKIRAFWFPPYIGAYVELAGSRYTLISSYILAQLGTEGAVRRSSPAGVGVHSADETEARRIKLGDDVAAKVRSFWDPPWGGAYMEIAGRRYTLVDEEILADLAPVGTTSLFSTRFGDFKELEAGFE